MAYVQLVVYLSKGRPAQFLSKKVALFGDQTFDIESKDSPNY